MSKIAVYLAGAMTGLTREEMTEWRDDATYMLRVNDFRVWNPVSTLLDGSSTAKEIVDSNKFMLMHSDIILAEMINRKDPSIGTICEIVLAGELGKPVIAFGDSPSLVYPWVDVNVTARLRTLEDAMKYIVVNYGCYV